MWTVNISYWLKVVQSQKKNMLDWLSRTMASSCRSSHRRCSVKSLRPATLLKKRLWHRCFLVSFVKFLRISFPHNSPGRLLLLVGRFWLKIANRDSRTTYFDVALALLVMCLSTIKSSHPKVFHEKSVFKIFAKSPKIAKHLCWGLFSNEIAGCWPKTLFKRDFSADVFVWIVCS